MDYNFGSLKGFLADREGNVLVARIQDEGAHEAAERVEAGSTPVRWCRFRPAASSTSNELQAVSGD